MALRGLLTRLRAQHIARETCDHDMAGERYDGIGATYRVCTKCGHEDLDLD